MTKELLAAQLNGREYGDEITADEDRLAKGAGLVVVFGYSDDNIEFRGAINDEVGCYGGREFMLDAKGVLPDERDNDWTDDEMADYFARKKSASLKKLTALWCAEGDYSWTFKTDIPHVSFEVMEDGGYFCRGIVFELAALN